MIGGDNYDITKMSKKERRRYDLGALGFERRKGRGKSRPEAVEEDHHPWVIEYEIGCHRNSGQVVLYLGLNCPFVIVSCAVMYSANSALFIPTMRRSTDQLQYTSGSDIDRRRGVFYS